MGKVKCCQEPLPDPRAPRRVPGQAGRRALPEGGIAGPGEAAGAWGWISVTTTVPGGPISSILVALFRHWKLL